MTEIASVLVYLFYGATLASLAYFVHKVFWLIRYKRIQSALVAAAVHRLGDKSSLSLRDWETFETTCWSSTLGDPDIRDPVAFIRRREEGLSKLRAEIKASRRSIEQMIGKALAGGRDTPEVSALVLSLRRLSNPPGTMGPQAAQSPGDALAPTGGALAGAGGDRRLLVTIDLGFPSVATPRPPDPKLYELKVRSRYGVVRRALVFFSGIADVVYSSQHVALMSQNTHVPTSVLVRRLSLVALVILVVLVDMMFGARKWLGGIMNGWVGPAAPTGDFLTDNLGAILAFVLWAAGYGAIYLAMYFAIRRRYQGNVRRLRQMRDHEEATLRSIREGHIRELLVWARGYGQGLDSAVEITLRHAEALVDHAAHRLRRRVAPQDLLDGAKVVADALFARLPESRGDVQDAGTTHKHSLAHYLWPRESEMQYQAEVAQCRSAWQHLELAVNELRRERPDPVEAHAVWRDAITYATLFAPLMPPGTAESLKRAYARMVEDCALNAEKDLEDLDRRLGDLARSLNDQLESARALVESKVELANQQIQADVAALSAEIIQVREQARLEAMAFEI
jgi:hypothetical protein